MPHDDLQVARLLLAKLGVSVEDLVGNVPRAATPMPTVRAYIAQVAGSVPPATLKAYGTYWRRIEEAWGDRLLDEPTPLEIHRLAEEIKARAVVRRNSRGGRTAAEHLVGALRCLYRHAVVDKLIVEADNPAIRVAKPRRLDSTRRALPDDRLAEINHTAGTTGNDPQLDLLLLRLHEESACRRGGALALTPRDLDVEQCLIQLSEKGGTVRWQPVSPTLMRHLVDHGTTRGAGIDDQLLRYRDGRPITARRYDYLWFRLGQQLPWVARQQVTTHWLRHTTLTWVERHFGYAVARAFAGHTGRSDAGTTSTYVRADLGEVAAAVAALTGEDHPLAVVGRMSRPISMPTAA